MSQIIAIASGKGGTGKSHFAAGISKALTELGNKVLLIDGSIGLRCLDIMLGVDDKVLYTYLDVEKGICAPSEAMTDCGGFMLISPPQNDTDLHINRNFFTKFCKDLQNSFDFIIIDCISGISEDFHNAITPADKVIIITEPTPESIRCADRTAAAVESSGNFNLHLVISKINPSLIKKHQQCPLSQVIDMLGINTIGIVPDFNYNNKKYSVSTAYKNIAKRLMGKKVPLMDL